MLEKVFKARNRKRAPQKIVAKFDNKNIVIKIKRHKEGEQFLIYKNSTNQQIEQKHSRKNEKKTINELLTLIETQIAHK